MKRKLVFLATIISTLTIFTANTNSVYAVDSTGVSISAKQNQLTEGWNINSDGSISYVKNGSKVTGWQKIFRNKYLMENCYGTITKILINPVLHAISFIVFLMLVSHPIIKRIDVYKKKS